MYRSSTYGVLFFLLNYAIISLGQNSIDIDFITHQEQLQINDCGLPNNNWDDDYQHLNGEVNFVEVTSTSMTFVDVEGSGPCKQHSGHSGGALDNYWLSNPIEVGEFTCGFEITCSYSGKKFSKVGDLKFEKSNDLLRFEYSLDNGSTWYDIGGSNIVESISSNINSVGSQVLTGTSIVLRVLFGSQSVAEGIIIEGIEIISAGSQPNLILDTKQASICRGQTLELVASSTESILWYIDEKEVGSGANFTLLPDMYKDLFSPFEITVTSFSSLDCKKSESIQITINEPDLVDLSNVNTQYCESEIPFYLPQVIKGIEGSWDKEVQSSGTYTFLPNDECYLASSIEITVLGPPNPGTISGLSKVCNFDSFSLTTDGEQGGQWSITSGPGNINSNGTIIPTSTGLIDVDYVISNSCGSASTSFMIEVLAEPNAGTIHSDQTEFCLEDGNIPLSLLDADEDGIWQSKNESILLVDQKGVVNPIAAGETSVYYIVNGNEICPSDTSFFLIRINNCGCQNPSAISIITEMKKSCSTDSILVEAKITGEANLIDEWVSSGNGDFVTDSDIGSNSIYYVPDLNDIGDRVEIYAITEESGLCTPATSNLIYIDIVSEAEAGRIEITKDTFCIGDLISHKIIGSSEEGEWIISDTDIISFDQDNNLLAIKEGKAKISYHVKAQAPCLNEDFSNSVTVFVNTCNCPAIEKPVLKTDSVFNFCSFDSIPISIIDSIDGMTYFWYETNQPFPIYEGVSFRPKEEGIYFVEAVDDACSSQSRTKVQYIKIAEPTYDLVDISFDANENIILLINTDYGPPYGNFNTVSKGDGNYELVYPPDTEICEFSLANDFCEIFFSESVQRMECPIDFYIISVEILDTMNVDSVYQVLVNVNDSNLLGKWTVIPEEAGEFGNPNSLNTSFKPLVKGPCKIRFEIILVDSLHAICDADKIEETAIIIEQTEKKESCTEILINDYSEDTSCGLQNGIIDLRSSIDTSLLEIKWENLELDGFTLDSMSAGIYEANISYKESPECAYSHQVIIGPSQAINIEWQANPNSTATISCENCETPSFAELAGQKFVINEFPFETDSLADGNYEMIITDQRFCRDTVVFEIDHNVDYSYFIPNVWSSQESDVFGLYDPKELFESIKEISIYNRWGNRIFKKDNISFDKECHCFPIFYQLDELGITSETNEILIYSLVIYSSSQELHQYVGDLLIIH